MAFILQKLVRLFSSLLFHLIPLLVFSVHVLSSALPAAVQTEEAEADSLLRWKASLDKSKPIFPVFLEYYAGRPCNWFDNFLTGTIPASIGNLTALPILYIQRNQLSGSLPQELGMLKFVTEIFFSENSLTGIIPISIGNLTNLWALYLDRNQLSGSIPQEIGMLRSLTELALSHNNLTGPIPTSIGNLTTLSYLYLTDNQLSNSLPREIGKLTKLTRLFLEMNDLSGTLPLEMNNFTLLEAFIIFK
ncbi:hypothetical protein GH714_037989 [Hevea brasiliensis]|uniref:Leucine-rich repeat-containing N-terminal plant-type domain-containing protein n=1 Tax=Hevea brasiliensis TaxID=3981 RepID=A0A6A6KG73_HEVBR|nr:hypothetical protein GH714_037989 [Hevea brasiliensis]